MKEYRLSIIVPCYNEENTLEILINKVLQQSEIIQEIIIIDDKSTDKSRDIILKISKNNNKVKYFFKEKNEGKGSALKEGFRMATGNLVLIQDADLEYDPNEYSKLLKPFKESNADVVYGSRFLGGDMVRLHFFWHYLANKILTFLCNFITNLNMSDMETGYKVIKSEYLKNINLKEKSFGIEPELTIKLAKNKLIFYEVPISYKGRTYAEGKKIGFKDALVALKCIFKYKILD